MLVESMTHVGQCAPRSRFTDGKDVTAKTPAFNLARANFSTMSADDHKQALPPGFALGSYRIVRVLGVGGFGVTYLCEHGSLGVQVAVKEYLPNEVAVRDGTEVHPKSAGDRESFEWGLERFLEEARTLAHFRHPNVVRVRDCFEANRTAYIVMDYEDGEPLDALLRRHGTLTEAQLRRIALPLADGLREVHAAGFLHRDVKPANVFVRCSDETPVLLDFGSARQALGRRSRSVTVIASAGYSPPEQYESAGEQGPWTDIYALSALCYRAITGNAPVEAPRRQGEMLRSRTDPLPSLAEKGVAGYSRAFLEAVDRGLHVLEAERQQSVDEWLPQIADTAVKHAPAATPSANERTAVDQAAEPEHPAAQATVTPIVDWRKAPRRVLRRALVSGTVLVVGLGLLVPLVSSEQLPSIDAGPVPPSPGAPLTSIPPDSVEALRSRAERDIVEAQNDLGAKYAKGDGVPQDHGEAVRWFRSAAEQGFTAAQNNLGVAYRDGKGVPQDFAEAVRWFRNAAEQGLAQAQYSLGMALQDQHFRLLSHPWLAQAHFIYRFRYTNDEGVLKSQREAAQWFHSAAKQGVAGAQYLLGVAHASGFGVTENYREAAFWFRKAADQGYTSAQYNLGLVYADVDLKAVLSLGVKDALPHGDILLLIPPWFRDTEGVRENNQEAVRWFRRAAEQGDSMAQTTLGLAYQTGLGIAEDDREAVHWFRKAAEQGKTVAQINLESSREGLANVPMQRNLWAQVNLGFAYRNGEGVQQDHHEASQWFRRAAEQRSKLAQVTLGAMYFKGEGVPRDTMRAYAWLNLAAEAGSWPFWLGVDHQYVEDDLRKWPQT